MIIDVKPGDLLLHRPSEKVFILDKLNKSYSGRLRVFGTDLILDFEGGISSDYEPTGLTYTANMAPLPPWESEKFWTAYLSEQILNHGNTKHTNDSQATHHEG